MSDSYNLLKASVVEAAKQHMNTTNPEPSQKLEDFLETNAGKKASQQKQREVLQMLGGITGILSAYNKMRLLDAATQQKCLALFKLNTAEPKAKPNPSPAADDIKTEESQPIESIKSEMSAKEIQTDFKNEKKKSYDAQVLLFLNVFWLKFENEKEDIFKIFSIYREKHMKFGEKDTAVGFGTFCNVLEMCEKEMQRVADCQSKYIGKVPISKRFQALGMKLGPNVSLLECLLFVYGEKMTDFVPMPRSPMDANMRSALANQAKVKAEGLKLSVERDALMKKMETAKPMKKAQMDLDLQRLNNEIQKNGVSVKRENKKQSKLVSAAKALLDKEKSNGTVPTNWFNQKMGLATGVREEVKAEKQSYDGMGDYAKKACEQCGKTAFGKVDNNDGQFYCNDCWSEF